MDATDDHAAAFNARDGFHCFTSQANRLFIPIGEIA
ncbi:hypothetical protein BDD21_2972 [Thiocapsa rosea]|uniref:Uncharacterized protein n=1 Tax=Thiocapsa rosea TaxID=69360 RepID=A0A495V7X6_9GAMM|nr:hypothetical protein BDD21_2972 [Thiocapsa rosea]